MFCSLWIFALILICCALHPNTIYLDHEVLGTSLCLTILLAHLTDMERWRNTALFKLVYLFKSQQKSFELKHFLWNH